MSYEPVIGLEVHAQLLTRSKLFCGCSAEFGAPPNTHACPVCMAFPGVLPVPNRRAVELAIRAGLASRCRIARSS
ncbi:MAG: Asp-tRNA(Asn)/Glu-tRNA(Gln) amidotransferase subunit GatB, partial [Candidatus Binatia bacterium]